MSNLIREKKTFQLSSVMQTSKRDGMQTFEDSILALVRAGTVLPEEAGGYGIDPEAIERAVREAHAASAPAPASAATATAAEAEAGRGADGLFDGLHAVLGGGEPRRGSLAARVSPR